MADAAAQAASRLFPDAGETHLAHAENLYRGYLDYDGALAELEAAVPSLPNDPRIFELEGYIQRRQGRWEEAIRNLERAADLDPRNVFTLEQLALSYQLLRRYAETESLLDRILTIESNNLEIKAARAFVELDWKADTRPLHQLIEEVRATNPGATQSIVNYWLFCALAERDAAEARDALIASGENPITLANENVVFSRPFVEGLIARMTNDDAKARSAFTSARLEQEKIIGVEPNYGPVLCVLGLIDAGLGRKEEALREGSRAVDLLPVKKDAVGGAEIVKYLAAIAACVNDKDLANEQLAIVADHPSSTSYGQLKLLPFWDPLRGDPRFEKIVTSLAPK
jgi:serine/threonine-protein kinase